MIGGYIKQAASHPVIAAGAGGLIGYSALNGSLFGGLLAAGTIGAYLQQRRMAKAKEAASAAAVQAATACGDPNDPQCVAEAKAAAITAGERVMKRRGVLPFWLAVLFAFAAAFIVAWAVNNK